MQNNTEWIEADGRWRTDERVHHTRLSLLTRVPPAAALLCMRIKTVNGMQQPSDSKATAAQTQKRTQKRAKRVVPARCLVSWQCIVHCIGMASATRPIPVHHETAPASAQSASSTPCGSREGVPAHAQGPNQASRPTPPCVFRRSASQQ
ncbi:hypothetical protein ACQKWADRAFT_306282 [Trichoderma austrokoningii]